MDAALSHDQMKQPPGGGKGKKGENKGGKQVIGAHHLAQVRPGMRRSAKMHRIRMHTHMFVLCGACTAGEESTFCACVVEIHQSHHHHHHH